MLQLDVTVSLLPVPGTSANLKMPTMHFRYGDSFITVDFANDIGQTQSVKVAITPTQQATLENVITNVVKTRTGATTVTVVPDPPGP